MGWNQRGATVLWVAPDIFRGHVGRTRSDTLLNKNKIKMFVFISVTYECILSMSLDKVSKHIKNIWFSFSYTQLPFFSELSFFFFLTFGAICTCFICEVTDAPKTAQLSKYKLFAHYCFFSKSVCSHMKSAVCHAVFSNKRILKWWKIHRVKRSHRLNWIRKHLFSCAEPCLTDSFTFYNVISQIRKEDIPDIQALTHGSS